MLALQSLCPFRGFSLLAWRGELRTVWGAGHSGGFPRALAQVAVCFAGLMALIFPASPIPSPGPAASHAFPKACVLSPVLPCPFKQGLERKTGEGVWAARKASDGAPFGSHQAWL